jgi:hypothetical protein
VLAKEKYRELGRENQFSVKYCCYMSEVHGICVYMKMKGKNDGNWRGKCFLIFLHVVRDGAASSVLKFHVLALTLKHNFISNASRLELWKEMPEILLASHRPKEWFTFECNKE